MRFRHFILILLSTWAISQAKATIDFGPVAPSARDAAESRQARTLHVAQQLALEPIGPVPVWPKVHFQEFLTRTIARLITGTNVNEVSAAILDPSFRPWKAGTDIAILGPLCSRKGDYDFVLMGLLRLAYLDEESGQQLLTPAAREKLRHELLNLRGDRHHVSFRLNWCPPFKKRDSENHILMSEVARYLTNQLLGIDNEANDFNRWLLTHLKQFLRRDYDEVNSRPYQGYTLIPLAILYDYARDERVKTTAQMLLDYLSAKTAIQSVGLRRYPPFRRQRGQRDANDLLQYDNTMSWYAGLTAKHDFTKLGSNSEISSYMFLMAATSKYQVPALILEMFFQRGEWLQKIKGHDVEAYFTSPNFLLTAGGAHRKVFGFFTGENDVWAMPTTIIPTNYGTRRDQLFQLVGRKHGKRNNMCIAPHFACGQNFIEPAGIPAECKRSVADWTFYDLENCSVRMGFYLAVKRVNDKALWEVRAPEVSFNLFMERVLAANPHEFRDRAINRYTTSDGHRIEFNWAETSRKRFMVHSYDGAPVERDFKRWKFAEGPVIQSEGDGLIQIHNPLTGEVLTLDGRDPLNPHRY